MNEPSEVVVAEGVSSDPDDRSVKPFELFFDLVFVFGFTQVTQLLVNEQSWGGLGQGTLLIVALWWAWSAYAWLGTAVDLDEGAVRLAMLLVMGGMLTAALAIPEAFGDNAVLVAGAIAFVRIMQVVLFGIAARKMPGMFMAVLRFVPSAMGAPMLIVVGAVTEIGPLEAWWSGALAFELVAMLVMGLSGWTVSPGHFSERHGLIFIIALGEAVISIGIGASHLKLDASVLVPALLGLGVIVAMWWAYFDVNALAAERRLSSTKGIAQVALAQHAYSYLHLPMIIGLIFFSLGVEMTLAHTGEVLGTIPAFALCGGLTMFLAAQIGFRLRSGGSLSIPRVVAVVALVAIFALSGLFTALFVLTSVAACFAVLIAYETVGEREERLRIRSSEHASWA